VYDSKKREWVLLRANCVGQQQKKLGIIESKLCMAAKKENGCYWEHTVYESKKRKWVLL